MGSLYRLLSRRSTVLESDQNTDLSGTDNNFRGAHFVFPATKEVSMLSP